MENGLEEHESGSQETGHKSIGVVHTGCDGGLTQVCAVVTERGSHRESNLRTTVN